MRPEAKKNWVAEAELAEQLNVPREVLLEARLKQEEGDVEWDGHFVMWKKTAAESFAESLGLAPRNSASPPPVPQIEILTVHSRPQQNGLHFPNPHVIKARRSNGQLVDVLVVTARNFTSHLTTGEPMTFKAQPGIGCWRLVGREPRRPGQW